MAGFITVPYHEGLAEIGKIVLMIEPAAGVFIVERVEAENVILAPFDVVAHQAKITAEYESQRAEILERHEQELSALWNAHEAQMVKLAEDLRALAE